MRKHGVLLSHLKSLPVPPNQDCTTWEVTKLLFRPAVAALGDETASYAMALQTAQPDLVKDEADCMVVHTHKERWQDLLDAIATSTSEDPFVWIDCVSLSPFFALETPVAEFREFFKSIQHVKVVVAPCRNPISVRRTWCTFEVITAFKTGKDVALVAPPSSIAAFRKLLVSGTASLEAELAFISTMHQQAIDMFNCGNASDYAALISTVRANPALVTKLTADFYVNHVLRAEPENTPEQKLVLLMARGLVHKLSGDAASARATYAQGIAYLMKHQGEHPRHLITQLKTMMADTIMDMGNFTEGLRQYGEILSHAEASRVEEADLRFKMAMCQLNVDDLSSAKGNLDKSLELRRQILGDAHELVADCLMGLGELYLLRHQQRDAIPLFEEGLAIRRADAVVHPEKLGDALLQLGIVYRDVKELGKACEYLLQCVTVRKRVLGEEHQATLVAMSLYAAALLSSGKLDKARSLLYHVVDVSKRVLGLNTADTATNIANLATLLHQQKSLEESSRLFEQAISIRKKVFGDESMEVAHAMAGLALVLKDRGMEGAAIGLGRMALAIAVRREGADGAFAPPRLCPSPAPLAHPAVEMVRALRLLHCVTVAFLTTCWWMVSTRGVVLAGSSCTCQPTKKPTISKSPTIRPSTRNPTVRPTSRAPTRKPTRRTMPTVRPTSATPTRRPSKKQAPQLTVTHTPTHEKADKAAHYTHAHACTYRHQSTPVQVPYQASHRAPHSIPMHMHAHYPTICRSVSLTHLSHGESLHLAD